MESDVRKRVVIENVKPEIDCGRFPIKRTVRESVTVQADIFSDGHDVVTSLLLYRWESASKWEETPMIQLVNDLWRGLFFVKEMGRYVYTVKAWVDRFKTWRRDLIKKIEVGQDIELDLQIGVSLFRETLVQNPESKTSKVKEWESTLDSTHDVDRIADVILNEDLADYMSEFARHPFVTTYGKELTVVVDRPKARFSSWYEMFPRSCINRQGDHGTFQTCVDRLPYIAEMGFDVLYLPPIHPIGISHRKGKNNAPEATADDPGSPWAIGGLEGGHKAIHPALGSLQDFRTLMQEARKHGIEIALDLAFQCTPDHPYVKEHPEWFRHRPDGSIQYAENPPKKYQDIYPLDFETDGRRELDRELKSVVLFWIEQGVKIFRVDNPHTKPFSFWERLITDIKAEYPEVIFLAEAFTRPKVMYRLAKLGFSQSYTYFAWRNTKWEIRQYFEELTQTEARDFFRPNLWPNTPDILPEYLQVGGRPAFMARLVLAATLGASYGIYGPAFELCENRSREPGSEEYLDSEKYEIKYWELDKQHSLKEFIARVNRIRRENPALQSDEGLLFHNTDNEQILCFSKQTRDLSNVIIVVVNLDPHHTHGGWLELPAELMGIESLQPFQVHDLLSDARYLWSSNRNYFEIDPQVSPAHIFRVRRRIRTERDFDYFM